ncbi:MAG: S8 family serine peptidase [Clostridium sp.]
MISAANLMFDGNLAESSNYEAKSVDIAAPGTYIVSTIADSGYGFMTGTSMSAPMVTGAAAMLYSYRTDLQLSDIRKVLLETARKLPTLNGKLSSNGMLDLYAALNHGRTIETADSAQTEQTAADGQNAQDRQDAEQTAADGQNAQDRQDAEQTAAGDQDAEQDPETGQGTASAASKTITAGGGEPVSLGW